MKHDQKKKKRDKIDPSSKFDQFFRKLHLLSKFLLGNFRLSLSLQKWLN